MTNITTMADPGRLNGTGLTDAQFLKLFTGEVLTAFNENNIMRGLQARSGQQRRDHPSSQHGQGFSHGPGPS